MAVEMTTKEYEEARDILYPAINNKVHRRIRGLSKQDTIDTTELIFGDVILMLWRKYTEKRNALEFIPWVKVNKRIIWKRIYNRAFDISKKGQIQGYRVRLSTVQHLKHADYTQLVRGENRSIAGANGIGASAVDMADFLSHQLPADRKVAEYLIEKSDLYGVCPALGITWWQMRQSLDRMAKQLVPEGTRAV